MGVIYLIILSFLVASTVKAKGRKRVGYILLLVALWIGGEVSGLMVLYYLIPFVLGSGNPTPLGVVVYADGGGSVGAMIGLLIIYKLAESRDQSPLRNHDLDDRDWRDRDYGEGFGSSDPKRNDLRTKTNQRPRREDNSNSAE